MKSASFERFSAPLLLPELPDLLVNGASIRVLIRFLEGEGWALITMEGSHRQFKHPTKPGRVTVSGSLGDDMPKGTLASVKRQAGLKVPTT